MEDRLVDGVGPLETPRKVIPWRFCKPDHVCLKMNFHVAQGNSGWMHVLYVPLFKVLHLTQGLYGSFLKLLAGSLPSQVDSLLPLLSSSFPLPNRCHLPARNVFAVRRYQSFCGGVCRRAAKHPQSGKLPPPAPSRMMSRKEHIFSSATGRPLVHAARLLLCSSADPADSSEPGEAIQKRVYQ